MDAEQRTDAWWSARLGRVTGSRMADVLSTVKTGEAAGRRNYRAQLVLERITGERVETFKSTEMIWGSLQEPLARLAFQLTTGLKVQEVGFIQHPTLMAGASPDGLVGDDACLEIKNLTSANHLEILSSGGVPSKYQPQIQSQMWVTGREKCYFVSYDSRMPSNAQLYIAEVARDQAYIDNLEEQVTQFLAEVDRDVELVRNYGAKAA